MMTAAEYVQYHMYMERLSSMAELSEDLAKQYPSDFSKVARRLRAAQKEIERIVIEYERSNRRKA